MNLEIETNKYNNAISTICIYIRKRFEKKNIDISELKINILKCQKTKKKSNFKIFDCNNNKEYTIDDCKNEILTNITNILKNSSIGESFLSVYEFSNKKFPDCLESNFLLFVILEFKIVIFRTIEDIIKKFPHIKHIIILYNVQTPNCKKNLLEADILIECFSIKELQINIFIDKINDSAIICKNVNLINLPKLNKNDILVKILNLKEGDVVKYKRQNILNIENEYWRIVEK